MEGAATGHPRRWFALVVLCLALSMIVIDNTILAVAIPSLGRELHADETDLQWIATSYGLVLAGLLLPLAVLGDRYGRKGLLLIGLAVFGAASGAAAFATSPLVLTITRGVMGVGGACMMPATLSILGNVFDERERGRAIAIWSGIAGVATAAGPIAGGLLLARFWWGSIFLVNVPIATIAIVAGVLLVPTSRDPGSQPLDRGSAWRWWGALTAALVAIIEGPQQGWTAPVVLAAAGLSVLLLAAFVHRERVSLRPMIPHATVRDPRLRWGAVNMAALFFSAFGVQFVLTQWLQGPRHHSALGAGAFFVPNAVAGIVASLRNPRWAARFGHGTVAAAGLACIAAGAAATGVCIAASSEAGVFVAAAVIGFGIGTSAPSGAELIMSSASADNARDRGARHRARGAGLGAERFLRVADAGGCRRRRCRRGGRGSRARRSATLACRASSAARACALRSFVGTRGRRGARERGSHHSSRTSTRRESRATPSPVPFAEHAASTGPAAL